MAYIRDALAIDICLSAIVVHNLAVMLVVCKVASPEFILSAALC